MSVTSQEIPARHGATAYTWAASFPAVKSPTMVVDGLFEAGTLAVIYGDSNTGKSTFALDLALRVARGATWRGRGTMKGIVFWLGLESPAGARRRVAAHCKKFDVQPGTLLFADVTTAVQMLDLHDVEALIAAIKAAETEAGEKCVLVVIDTVARAMAGADENDGRDMGLLVKGCDLVRQETGATVLMIHHSGKNPAKGARGHSSLRAAVDTEIEVTGKTNPRQAMVTKQRDLPCGEALAFDLEPIEIGTDVGESVTACIVVDREGAQVHRPQPAGRNQQALLAGIREHVRVTESVLISTIDLREIAKVQGLADRRRLSEARESLQRDGWLVPTVGGYKFMGDEL